MFVLWSKILFCLTIYHSLVDSQYLLGKTVCMRRKISKMDRELVEDVIVKIHNVGKIRELNYRSAGYQVGNILCTIKKLLEKIVTLYKQVELAAITNEELFEHFEEVHDTWYRIEHLIRIVEQWEEKKNGRRSGRAVHVGPEEYKRWALLEEGETLDDIKIEKEQSSKSQVNTKKRKIWQAGMLDGTGF